MELDSTIYQPLHSTADTGSQALQCASIASLSPLRQYLLPTCLRAHSLPFTRFPKTLLQASFGWPVLNAFPRNMIQKASARENCVERQDLHFFLWKKPNFFILSKLYILCKNTFLQIYDCMKLVLEHRYTTITTLNHCKQTLQASNCLGFCYSRKYPVHQFLHSSLLITA